MPFETLISCEDAHDHVSDPDWAFVDSRFVLTDFALGERDYVAAHIPGATYAHLDRELSRHQVAGKTGRHPLPTQDELVATLSRMGIGAHTQVVSYDANTGVMASRLWWLLRWAGHTKVAVLDGGMARWQQLGFAVRSGVESRAAAVFVPHFIDNMNVDLGMVDKLRQDPTFALFDVRAADRYRGENEMIDAVGGHIPGAKNLPFNIHLGADGLHLTAAILRDQFLTAEAGRTADHVVFSCGSGITAAHAAMLHLHAGLPMAKIYAGSFSEWIVDPARPVATGQ